MSPFIIGIFCLAIGIAVGIFAAVVSLRDEDSACIDYLEEYRLTLSNFEGRWAVFQTMEGKQVMIGQSHETARGALLAARGHIRG